MLPFLKLGPALIPMMSLMLMSAYAVCYIFFSRSRRYSILYICDAAYKIPFCMLCAFLGGRGLSLLVSWQSLSGPVWYKLIFGGFVFYGGLLGGLVGLAISCAWHRRKAENAEPFLFWADLLFSLLPLGQAIGRLGCFFNGCCYGMPWHGPLGISYPVNGQSIRVFPTWFAESAFCLLLFVYLQQVYKKRPFYYHPGMPVGGITARYLACYTVFRFCLEFFRGDEIRGSLGFLSTSQLISLAVLTAVALAAGLRKLRTEKTVIE